MAAPARPRRLSGFEWACLGVVAVSFLFRLDYVLKPDAIWDSAWYLMLGRSFAERGDFWIRWTDPAEFSGYWPPLFPILVSGMVRLFGASYQTLAATATLASALLALAVLLTTWDLMGRTRAFAAMALVAASPAFLGSDMRGMGESTLALMVVLALWAFLKSLERPVFLPLAALFGLGAYLSKANLGLPFVAAGLVAVAAWRVRRKGRAVLRSPVDLAVAGVAVVGLALALLLRGGGSRVGSVGLGVIDPVREAVSHPMWVPFLLFKLAFASAFLLVVALPLSLRLRDALRAPRTERADALWLAVLLPILATGVFTASFLITEKRGPIDIVPKVAEAFGVGLWTGFKELTYNLALLVDFDNVRYLTPALVPFLWLLLPHVAFESDVPRDPEIEGARVRRRHERLFVAAAALYAAVLLFNPITGLRIPSEGRVWAFFLMALVPLAVALVARSQRYDVAERRAGGTTTRRYVEAKPPPIRWRPVLLLALAGLALAYLGSLWYAIVLVGLAVALASQSRRGAVVAMALFLLCASAVQYRSPFPAEEASAWLAETLPPGTVIGAAEPIVYFAAVAPDGMPLRLVDPANPPPDVQAMVIPGGRGYGEYPNFTAAAAWDYDFSFSPPLEWRLAVERDVLGNPIALEKQRGITVFVRNGTLPAQP